MRRELATSCSRSPLSKGRCGRSLALAEHGDITHPSIVYVVGPDGRLRYAVNGTSEQIIAAIGAM